jgi:hypothetical protein
MTSETLVPRKPFTGTLAILSVVLAVRLFVPATTLAFSRQEANEFNATGLPHWMRFALAMPEILGAVLFAIPRTFYIGTLVLLFDLAGAVAVHLSLGVNPTGLYLLLAAVLLLAMARHYRLP